MKNYTIKTAHHRNYTLTMALQVMGLPAVSLMVKVTY